MFVRKRSQLGKHTSSSRSRRRHELRVALFRQSLKPRFETLEIRALLATVTWDGGAGSFLWGDAANWTGDALPGIGDDVVIPDLVGTPTIKISNPPIFSVSVGSVTSAERLEIGTFTTVTFSGDSTFGNGFDLDNSATFSGAKVTISGNSTWFQPGTATAQYVNNGTINLETYVLGSNLGTIDNFGTLNITAGGGFLNNTSIFNKSGGQMSLSGDFNASNSLTNRGTLATSTDASFAGPLDNIGTVQVLDGTLTFSGTVAQFSGPILTGGTWIADGLGPTAGIAIPSGVLLTTIGPGAFVSTHGSAFYRVDSVTLNQGTFRVSAGSFFVAANASSSFANEGQLIVPDSSSFEVNVGTLSSPGVIKLGGSPGSGGTIIANTVDVQAGGLLRGNGIINANIVVDNGGTIAPGSSPGIITINGNLTLNVGSVTNIEVQGTNPATPDFDQILVSGTATLAGTLNVSLLNGFIPDKTESFQIMTFASRSGDFTTQNFPSYSNYNAFASSPGATTYNLTGTVYAVRNTNDSGNNSLRKAISDANASPGADAILFNIAGTGVRTITPLSGLPTTTGQLVIDATSQSGYAGTPLIEIRGDSAGNVYGVAVSGALGSGSVIKGLAINRFQLSGVLVINGANGVTVQNNYIGTNAGGTAANANSNMGVDINRSSGTIVSNNLISGNGDYGIGANAGGVAGSVDGTVITGNRIGTNAAGTAAIGNAAGGIYLGGATNSTIGGTTFGARNIISGNTTQGVTVNNSTGNEIRGNYIGTDVNGTGSLPNETGVFLVNASTNNLVVGNAISSNTFDGVLIQGSGSNFNKIQGNIIGLAADGSVALGNGRAGIFLYSGASGNVVGIDGDGVNDDFTERNIISGNATGVYLQDNADNNRIAGNYIGTNLTGTAKLGAQTTGVLIFNATVDDTVIGTNADGTSDGVEGNVISGNQINVDNRGNKTIVAGNRIGTNAAGTGVIAGSSYGVVGIGSNARIGTKTLALESNVIVGATYGVSVGGATAIGNTVAGNFIGVLADGVTAAPNFNGVHISAGATSTTIGGTSGSLTRNIISGNTGDGVVIRGTGTADNKVFGNYIGTNAIGTGKVANNVGVTVDNGASNNFIGTNGDGTNDGTEGNVISGNNTSGILIRNAGTDGNRVAGNLIGTDYLGTAALGNGAHGIHITLDASNTIVGSNADGTSDTLERNVISGNGQNGVHVDFIVGTITTMISGNTIGLGLSAGGATAIANAGQGVYLQQAALLNVFTNVISGNSQDGIQINGAGTTAFIASNLIGTNTAGTAVVGNVGSGIDIRGGATGTRIGGTGPIERNAISGNARGIQIDGATTTGNIITGNSIGTGRFTDVDLGNANEGVRIQGGAHDNTIGGTVPGAGNVISGNTGFGIQILGAATSGNIVRGNLLGTDYDGQVSIGNGIGIRISGSSTNVIGGLGAGQANVIAFSGGAGIQLPDTAATSSAIRGNRIYNNIGLAIDVGAAGATLNDSGDSDGYRNAPVFTSAVLSGGNLILTGFARPNAQIDLFSSNPTLSGYGQGKQFLTTLVEGTNDTDATTGTYGPGPVLGRLVGTDTTNRFQFSIPLSTLPATLQTGSLLAAVSIGSTSEFSAIAVVGDPASSLKPIVDIGPDIPLLSDLLFDRVGTFVDPDSTQWTVLVNYGDGSPEQSIAYSSEPIVGGNGFGQFGDGPSGYDTVYRFQLRHQYERAGSFVVTVRVIDNASAVGTDTAILTGSNQAPDFGENVLTLTPARINEGGSVTLVGRFTDSSIQDTYTASVDWGDGAITPGAIDPITRTFSATHVYLDDGLSNAPEHAYPIQATLIDNLGASDKTTFGLIYARVVNVQPSNIQLTLNNTNLTESDVVTLGGTFVEPGILDTHVVTIDWGDSSPQESFMLPVGTTSFSRRTHSYLNDVATGPDRYSITVKIADDDQFYEPVIATTFVNVLNAAPQIVALNSSDETISEGQSLTIGGDFFDLGTLDGHTVTIHWGDGSALTEFELSAGVTTFAGISHPYVDDSHALPGGVFAITLTVSDHDGGSISSALQVTVLNVAPTVSGIVLKSGGVVVTGPIAEGTNVVLMGNYSDPGLIDQQLVRIYWGDGTDSLASVNAKTSTFRATHRYVDDRPSSLPSLEDKIVVVVDDQDLGVSTTSFTQVVTNVAPTAAIMPDLGSTLTTLFFKAAAGDAGSADVPTLTYQWTVALAPGVTGNNPIVMGGDTNPTLQIDRNGNLTASYVVTLAVSDDEFGTTTVSSTIIVLDNTSNIFIPTLAQQPSGTSTVTILGLDGDDLIDVSAWTIATVLDGGMGDDTLIDGSGNSTLFLHQGNDTGRGNGGDDTYLTTFNSTQTIDDSFGANILDFSPTSFGVTFDLKLAISSLTDKQDVQPSNPGVHFADINGSFAQLIGTSGADNFTLASGVTSNTGAGNDTINVRAGTTSVKVDAGADNDVFLTFGIGSIGSIDFQGDIGADTFTNAFGVTIDSVDMGGGADNDVFQNYGAITGMIDFQGDFGADTFTNFAGGLLTNVDMGGGADNDVFQNFGIITGQIDFQGDVGVDRFTNKSGATISNINMVGGADNDVFQNYGGITGTIDFQGDFGIDTFTNELSATLVNVNMGGGADNDVFQNYGAITGLIDFQGDFGADTFTNEVGATILNVNMGGGADNDVFQNFGIITGLVDFKGDIGADTFTNELSGTISNVNMGGGADNDVFQNLGTITGLIDFQGDIGADTFTNEVGATILNVNMGGGADNDVFQNLGTITGLIDFKGDIGADTFTNELGATLSNINMGGGADNDVFQNYGGITGTIDFQGDSGRDLFINRDGARTGTATAPSIVRIRGNADNDIFVNFGLMNSTITMNGGADNDVFQNLGIITGTIDFQGDIGADTFVNGPGAFINGGIDMGGGADNDVFQNFGSVTGTIDFIGDIGADTFTNFLGGQLTSVTMNGGADNDVFLNFGLVGNITMNGGADNDVFANAGTLTGTIDFQGDSGIDTLVNDIRGIAGTINMGGGADADYFLNYGRARSISFLGSTGNDTMLVDGVVEGAIFFNGDLDADVLIDSGTGFLVNGIPTTTIQFLGGSDLDALQNNASNILLIDFQGDDGADVFQNNGDSVRQIRFTGGIGDDTFENNAAKVTNIRFDAGDGVDRLFNDGNEVTGIEFIGGNDLDALLNTGSFVSQITMNGGADNDYFINSGSQVSGVTFDGGVGDDQIQNYGKSLSQVTFIGGDGNDLFRNRSSAEGSSRLSFNGDIGADTFVNEASSVSQITMNGGADNDVFLNFGLNTTNVDFSGDAGNDIFQNSADDFARTSSLTVPGARFVGGDGNDQFFHRGDRFGWLDFNGGNGLDQFNVGGMNGARVTFAGGNDIDTLVNFGDNLSFIDFAGDDGSDTFVNIGNFLGEAHFRGGLGDDQVDNRGSDLGWLEFAGGDENDFLTNSGARIARLQLIGGNGADAMLNRGSDVSSIEFDGGDGADSLNSIGSGYSSVQFLGGIGDDTLVVSGVGKATAIINGNTGPGNDVVALKGSYQMATIDGDSGNDRFHLFGNGGLTINGGAGNDQYYFIGNPTSQVSIQEAANTDQDLLSFASFTGGGITLDLEVNSPQPLSPTSQLSLTLQGNTTGIEDVIGTVGLDTIYGNARPNRLLGAETSTLTAAIAPVSSMQQWVLLDFDSSTDTGEHYYTQAERDQIQARIASNYQGPGGASNPWFHVYFTQDRLQIPTLVGANYATIYFNRTPESGTGGGHASDLDFRNVSLQGESQVQVNGIVGAAGYPEATSDNFIALSAKIGAHELGHLLGLRHEDAVGPIGYGLHSPPGNADYKPAFTGPSAGYDAFDHLIGSPATVGSDRFNDLRSLFFGEREAVKLAFNESGTSIPEGSTHSTFSSAQPINMLSMNVPNTLISGFNAGKQFDVAALNVTGSIDLDSTGKSRSDWYSFAGKKGELVNLAIYSAGLSRLTTHTQTIDSILRVYDASGVLVPYYDGVAVNDDQFEPTDSSLTDLVLPADGIYYIEVDTFARAANDPLANPDNPLSPLNPNYVPPGLEPQEINDAVRDRIAQFQDALLDRDTGSYELFVYRFATRTKNMVGDVLLGRGGVDTLDGGPGTDYSLKFGTLPTAATSLGGSTYTATIPFSNPGAATWTASVNYGDGTIISYSGFSPLTGIPLSHLYASNGIYTITIGLQNDDGAAISGSYLIVVNSVTNVNARYVQTLNATACGSLTLTGNAQININGPVVVNSSCSSSAVSLNGNTRITATQVRIVGGAQVTGNSTISPSPTTGAVATPDPLALLAAPSGIPATSALSCSGNSIMTVNPGSYTSINASGNCRITFLPGIYIIDGGGMNVSGNASVTGSDVMFYNAGSNFLSLGGNFGSINLRGAGTFNLNPLTTGIYSGVTFFQARDNTKTLSMSGNAIGMKGTVYAPKAQLLVSGNGQLQMTIIVDRLNMSGNAISSLIVGALDPDIELTMNPSLGQLNANVLLFSIESSTAFASRDQLDRIRDAIQTINNDFGSYGVRLVEIDSELDRADVRLQLSDTSPCGGLEQGILGCSTKWGEITLVNGWAWYAGADENAITTGQFDLQTIVTHELGHSIGLEHSSEASSVMYARLQQGVARRGFSDHDFAILRQEQSDVDSEHDYFDGLHAWDLGSISGPESSARPMVMPIIPSNTNETRREVDAIMNGWPTGQASAGLGLLLQTRDSAKQAMAQAIPSDVRSSMPKVGNIDSPKTVADIDSFFESIGEGSLDAVGLIGKRTRKARG